MSDYKLVTDCDSCGKVSCCRESDGGLICRSCDQPSQEVKSVDEDFTKLKNKGILIPKHLLEAETNQYN